MPNEVASSDAAAPASTQRLSPILQAALDTFVDKGFHGASVREIASRAGLTVPSLYYHYDSKEGMLRAVLMESLGPIADAVDAAAARGGEPAERLANVVEAIVLAMTVESASAAIDASEARYLGAENHARYVEVRDRIEQTVQTVLTDGVDAGSFHIEDVSETRRAILGMTQAIPRWYHASGEATPEEIAGRYARMVLAMVGANAAS